MEFLNEIGSYGPWFWIVVGAVLLALELVVPGGFLLWLGVAGVITGLASIVQPIDWPFQFLLFGGLALVLIVAWIRYFKPRERASDRPYLNRRAEAFVGHEAVLSEPIRDGFGRISLGDTIWRVQGPDLPAGRKVRIVAAEGAVLKVEAAA
ncbi:MAG TPA: NfeD family protein [Alphaproteobacteria bacterium]|nr:NfeD family protein [Alphaproteobacteria bacterium]